MKFYTNYNRKPVSGTVNSGKKLVKTAGYVPLEEQLIRFQQAGDRLQMYRESQYMYRDDSLAQRDSSMPHDIYQDKLDALDIRNEFAEQMAAKAPAASEQNGAPAASEQRRAADDGGATLGATTEDKVRNGEAAQAQAKMEING